MKILDKLSKPKSSTTVNTVSKPSTISRLSNLVIELASRRKTETIRKEDRYYMPYDPETMQNLGVAAYLLCGQVYTGFNMIAYAITKGMTVKSLSNNPADEEKIKKFVEKVRLTEKAEMIVINTLCFGRCIMEWGKDYLKVRDPRDFRMEWDLEKQMVVDIKQENNTEYIDRTKIETFMFRRLFSDSEYGISACYPAFNTIEDLLEIYKSNREILKRFRKPLIVAYKPDGASDQEEADMISMFSSEDYKGWYIVPEGWQIKVEGTGNAQFKVDDLMKQVAHQIFYDIGIPEALFQPDANRATTNEHIKLILYERIKPEQDKLKAFMEYAVSKHLKIPVQVTFDEMRTEDSLMRVKILQEILTSVGIGQNMKAAYMEGNPQGQEVVDLICSRIIDEAKILVEEGIL